MKQMIATFQPKDKRALSKLPSWCTSSETTCTSSETTCTSSETALRLSDTATVRHRHGPAREEFTAINKVSRILALVHTERAENAPFPARRLDLAKLWDVAAVLQTLAKASPEEPPAGQGEEGNKGGEPQIKDPPVCTSEIMTVNCPYLAHACTQG